MHEFPRGSLRRTTNCNELQRSRVAGIAALCTDNSVKESIHCSNTTATDHCYRCCNSHILQGVLRTEYEARSQFRRSLASFSAARAVDVSPRLRLAGLGNWSGTASKDSRQRRRSPGQSSQASQQQVITAGSCCVSPSLYPARPSKTQVPGIFAPNPAFPCGLSVLGTLYVRCVPSFTASRPAGALIGRRPACRFDARKSFW